MADAGSAPIKVLEVVPGKSDKEMVEDYKRKLGEAYLPVLKVLDEMHKLGFEVASQVAMGPFGQHIVTSLTVFKKY